MPRRKLKIASVNDNFECQESQTTDFANEQSETSEFTMLKAIEKIVLALENSHLDKEIIESCSDAVAYLKDRCQFNDWQAMLFALCVNLSSCSQISLWQLCNWIDCPMVCILSHQSDLDKLVEMGALIEGSPDNLSTYSVPPYVMDGLKKNLFVTSFETTGLSFAKFFDNIGQIFNRRRNGLSYDKAIIWINKLIKDNSHLSYCKHILSYKGLQPDELLLLHFFCHRAVNHNCLHLSDNDLMGILDSRFDVAKNFRRLNKGQHPLIKLGLVECANDGGMGCPSSFSLTSNAITSLLIESGIDVTEEQVIGAKELVCANDITPKDMYYTSTVNTEISRLSMLITPEHFNSICDRLTAAGMRRGFACLFHGSPGTGKTETALQLARISGRDIMQVNISDMRSKWVGETEKMVKGLFDRYRKAVTKSEVAPILLFNEADALFTHRNDNTVTAVDKMENAMQNIFLQEIERFDGILIATTNLTSNLDPAFERRFLYKIFFEKPDADCRKKMWKSMIKDLDDDIAAKLATMYDFSGGQIENIARKHIVDTILYGEPQSLSKSLASYCDSEQISRKASRHIGFVHQNP